MRVNKRPCSYFLVQIMLVAIFGILVPAMVFSAGDSFTQKDRELFIRLDERLNQNGNGLTK